MQETTSAVERGASWRRCGESFTRGCNWLAAVLRALRRPVGRRRERSLQLVEALPIGRNRQLILVRCGRQHFLVGAGGDSVDSIAEVRNLEDSEPAAESAHDPIFRLSRSAAW